MDDAVSGHKPGMTNETNDTTAAVQGADPGGFAEHNVIASFADMDAARAAIGALEDHGVDAGRISLLGRQAAEAVHDPDSVGRDERMMDVQARTAAKGAAAGAGVGGTVGFLAGVAAFGVPGIGPAVAGGIWAMTLGGAAAGSGVGLATNAYARIKQSEAWEASYDTVSAGRVVVGVHTPDAGELEDAERILADHGGHEPSRFDREGRRLG